MPKKKPTPYNKVEIMDKKIPITFSWQRRSVLLLRSLADELGVSWSTLSEQIVLEFIKELKKKK